MLGRVGDPKSFFSPRARTGSHRRAIGAVLQGTADVAAIDSTAALPRDGLRTLERLGPFAIQPIVDRTGLAAGMAKDVAQTLTTLHQSAAGRSCLELAGYRRFVAVDDRAYRSGADGGLDADVG